MNIYHSVHSSKRAQQRSIPPMILNWLLEYGEEQFDGRGGIVRYFSHGSIRNLKRDQGHRPVRLMKRYLGAYAVESTDNPSIITTGWRNRRIPRR